MEFVVNEIMKIILNISRLDFLDQIELQIYIQYLH